MKRKVSALEKQLRRPQAELPAGLRLRTFQRMGLRTATPWYARRALWASALASLLLLLLVRVASVKPTVGPGYQQEAISSERSQELAYASRHPGTAGPTTAMQVMEAKALLRAEDAGVRFNGPEAVNVETLPQQSTAALGVAPADVIHEVLAAPASSKALPDERQDAKTGVREAYRLTVKKNRIRPALGEQVLIELQAGGAGGVRIHVIDQAGRLIKILAELNDSAGPVITRWDGLDASGQAVPSGAYTIIIQSPSKTEKVGVLIIR